MTPEQRRERAATFAEGGLIHVTGLIAYRPCGDGEGYEIQARRGQLGKWGGNNGVVVLVTGDGEVWLASGSAFEKVRGKATINCPNGFGAYVPCSNGEVISMHDLMARVADPYGDIHGRHSPIPKIRD